jgi:hypothetical protein
MLVEMNSNEESDGELEASTMSPSNVSYIETAKLIAELVMSTRTTAGPRGDPDRSLLRSMGLI